MAKNKTGKKKNKMKSYKKVADLLAPVQLETIAESAVIGVANPRRIRL